jgi:hypothetical protein
MKRIDSISDADARLIALAPELAALVLDMADELRGDLCVHREACVPGCECEAKVALLARLDRISTQPSATATGTYKEDGQ